MKISKKGIDAIKTFEGCKLSSYKCPAGVWTIGYGHTRGVKQGQKITEAEATRLLMDDIARVEQSISSCGIHKQGQHDAIVDFVFNLGATKFFGSTLYKKMIKNIEDKTIPNEIKKWVYGGGKVLQGLVKRRAWEAQRWLE